MHGHADVSERILNFGAFVEAEAADQFVTDAAGGEGLFEGA